MDRTGATNQAFAGKDPRSDDIFAKDSLACPNFRSKVSLENHRGFRIYDQKIWDATNFYKLSKQISYV